MSLVAVTAGQARTEENFRETTCTWASPTVNGNTPWGGEAPRCRGARTGSCAELARCAGALRPGGGKYRSASTDADGAEPTTPLLPGLPQSSCCRCC